MSQENENQNTEESDLTIKEVSGKLDISEATVKKYIKDFELQAGKGSGNKAIISTATFQALSEISKLRANGLSIQEIKELKTQQPSKNILDQLEEDSKLEKEIKEDEDEKIDILSQEISVEEVLGNIDLRPVLDEELLPIEGAEEGQEIAEGIEEGQEVAEGEEPKEDSEEKGKPPLRTGGTNQEESQPRKRGFNYRYVERQISSDSKRVMSLRQRLRNPNLAVKDRLFFEEAVERRILLLNGWKHILKWVSRQ